MGEAASAAGASYAPHRVTPAGSSRPHGIFAEQVRHLYRFSVVDYAASLLCAIAVVSAMWRVLPVLPLTCWAVGVALLTAGRYALYRRFLARDPAVHEARRWCAWYIVGAVLNGVLWGMLGSAVLAAPASLHALPVMLIIGALSISCVLVLAPVRHAFLAFLLPAVLPVVATLFFQRSSAHFEIGVLLLVVLALMIATGRLFSRTMRDAVGMKIEHNELLARLSETHAAARKTNLELSEQVHSQRRAADQFREASQKLEAMMEASPLAIVALDLGGRVECWNAAAERIFGWSHDETRGRAPPYRPAGTKPENDVFLAGLANGHMVAGAEAVLLRKDGKAIDVSVAAAPLRDSSGSTIGYLTIMADITERKRVQKQHEVTARISMLLSDAAGTDDALPQIIATICKSFGFAYGARWILDRQSGLLSCAETWSLPVPEIDAFREQSEARQERAGTSEGLIRRVWMSAEPVWISDIEQDPTLRRRAAALEAGLRCAFAFPLTIGSDFYGLMEFFARDVREPDDTVMHAAQSAGAYVAQFIARKQAERNLQFVASHDTLTGLFNRSMFSDRLGQALAQAQRHERRLAVLFIDLDGFKLINDTLGHDAGDVLLVDLATRLRECMREGDTLGRMGGDEFVVLIESYREDAQLLDVARKVLDTVARPFILREGAYSVTASIGIAAFPQDGRDAAELLKNADIAMYRAKEQGKNNFRFHSSEMNTHLAERVNIETALRRALERGELTLFYQPRISVRDNRVTGVEALLRWVHPTQGVLNAPEFVPLAEEAGLFGAIGDWSLHAACRQLHAWHQRGVAHLRIAVNLSTRQFGQDNLIERLREAVHSSGIQPKQLEIEITESILMRHSERAARLLAQVKDLGAQVVVDDFGTGYSSLGCLRRFPVDMVKIDRSLVAQLPHGTAAVTRAVIAMAHSLGLHVVAEGVETRPQWEFLSENGCDAVQGNYYCAPAPEETVSAMLFHQSHATARVANLEQFKPWRAWQPGSEPDLCYTEPESPGGVR
jgi:diguanylate cyclase (GGDEF)-like protein/PAS domain S-box-containing protein